MSRHNKTKKLGFKKRGNKSRKRQIGKHFSVTKSVRNEIHDLPGLLFKLPSRQFNGYVNIPNTQKYIHYWFIESEEDPANAPLLFWTNGGPGCSGMIALFEEFGPMRPNKKLQLEYNKFSWTKFANIVFIEQPAGVGFSYSKDKKDYKTNDRIAAKDNLQVTLEFLKLFPEYSKNPLYLTSESYGGHYIPMWACEVIDHNKDPTNCFKINLKGLVIGNPYLDYLTGVQLESYWQRQIISYADWKKYKKRGCNSGSLKKYRAKNCDFHGFLIRSNVGKLNPYALDYSPCGSHQQHVLINRLTTRKKKQIVTKYDSCIESYTKKYLNLKSVQKALNVKKTHWGTCTRKIDYKFSDHYINMKKYFDKIFNDKTVKDMQILIFSGNDDSICSTVGTQKWLATLERTSISNTYKWRPYSVYKKTAGYISKFKSRSGNTELTFATVNGAGHEVPMYKPIESFHLIKYFLNKENKLKPLKLKWQ